MAKLTDGPAGIPRPPVASTNESSSSPASTRDSSPSSQCCCGADCAVHGARNANLRGLERDVHEAAKAGQALLARHEAYVADAEKERARMSADVAQLDESNKELETRNTTLKEDNSQLQDQLEELNSAIADSDAHVKSLEAALRSTQQEVERLARLAAKTEYLEAQLLECERAQAELQASLTRSVEEERAAVQRWRNAQRKIVEIQEQVEAIEMEASEERARHEEVVERLRRRQTVEKHLHNPASASAHNEEYPAEKKSEVVSSFVKEILQDNANMQLAMVELQDLLAHYKELELEQPQSQQMGCDDLDNMSNSNLAEELGMDRERREVHVHHHYHAPAANQKETRSRSQVSQRPKRRRPVLMSGRGIPAMSHAQAQRHKSAESTSSIGSIDRITKSKRWSTHSSQSQSSFAVSSGPSSPTSMSYCPSTIFEQGLGDDGNDFSRPTSPGSTVWSPLGGFAHRKLASDDSSFAPLSLPMRAVSDPTCEPLKEAPAVNNPSGPFGGILTQSMSPPAATIPPFSIPPPSLSQTELRDEGSRGRPQSPSPKSRLRRTESQASLVSISGMDIHSSVPSPRLAPVPVFAPQNALNSSSVVLTAATALAMQNNGRNSSTFLNQSLRGTAPGGARAQSYNPLADTFGKRFGGWLSSRLPGSSKPSASDLRGRSAADRLRPVIENETAVEASEDGQTPTAPVAIPPPNKPASISSSISSPLSPSKKQPLFRSPGVNQNGGLPPLPVPRPKNPVFTRVVDEDALRESLTEGTVTTAT